MAQEAELDQVLEADDYILPLVEIRDALLRPDADLHSLPRIRLLLAWHIRRLQTPWEPFQAPSSTSRAALNSSTVIVPHTTAQIDIEETARQVSLRLSDRIDVDEIDCLLLVRSYDRYAVDDLKGDEEGKVERVALWYAEEALAVPQIVLALYGLAQSEAGDWELVAADVRAQAVEDESRYVEELFRAFSVLAQKQLKGVGRSDNAIFWAIHQLRLQDAFLHLIFLVQSSTSNRPAAVSEGLLKGAIMSSFGTLQSNWEIWEAEYEAQRLQIRIRDILLVIALDSMCLSEIIPVAEGTESPQGSLLRSRDKIIAIHLFLLNQSEDLAAHASEPESGEFPVWPMPIICLAWAIVLRSLPQDLLPPSPGFDGPIYQEFATRALRLQSGLFPWLEDVLAGPLFEPGNDEVTGDAPKEGATNRRVVMKDLIMGFVDSVQLEAVADRPGFHRVWELLFGGGSPSTSTALCHDFWTSDAPIDTRRAVLEKSLFPSDPVSLLGLLASLAGSSLEAFSNDAVTDPLALLAQKFFSNLTCLTFSGKPACYRFVSKDAQGKIVIEASKDLILPGGAVIRRGAQGILLNGNGAAEHVITWHVALPGWDLLVEILRVAAGLRAVDERPYSAPGSADFVHLSVGDLGLKGSAPEILKAGLKLLGAVLRSSSTISHILRDIGISDLDLLQTILTILDITRSSDSAAPYWETANLAIEVMKALLSASSPHIRSALRSSAFFGVTGRRRGAASTLIQKSAAKGEHIVTISILQLVSSLIAAPKRDEGLLISALHLVFGDVWSQYLGWRYRDVGKKYEIGSLLVSIFDDVLGHPLDPDGSEQTGAARYLIEAFIHSASPLTYRPLTETITQAGPLIRKLFATRRPSDARLVINSLEASVGFMATLLRTATLLVTSADALPMSILATPVQVVDTLIELAIAVPSQDSTRLASIQLLRTWLESISAHSHRISLAGLLKDAETSCRSLGVLARDNDSADIQASVWQLLQTIVSTQPGSAAFCIGTPGDAVSGILSNAIEQVTANATAVPRAPHVLAALLGYLQAVLMSPAVGDKIHALRKEDQFWQAVFAIATYFVPAPPTFTLSMHSESFTARIRQYAYSVQAKANATALLAIELASILESEEEGETKAQSLVLSVFRNPSALEEVGVGAVHSSCSPALHDSEAKKLAVCGASLSTLKTGRLPNEREYGRTYLYDGSAYTTGGEIKQATVNLAQDMLNLNWSMLDADLSFTKSFLGLCEVSSAWTNGDALAIKAALRAAVAIAELLAEEERGGDVMLAIQVERLNILSFMLETALDTEAESDPASIRLLASSLRTITESQNFQPMIGLRHPELPPIHKPVLRILFLLLRSLSAKPSADLNIDSTIEAATLFVLHAADVVLDGVIRGQSDPLGNLSQIVGVLCEIISWPSTTVWLDKMAEHNLLARSIEVVSRSRITDDFIPPSLTNVLILHLGLASHPLSAEKLAVSGVLPAYSNNAITTEAEQGRIVPINSPVPNNVHSSWCGMLRVVKALLSRLPESDRPGFTRSDVVPFLRVCTAQLRLAMRWDGETPLSQSAMDELEVTTDVFYTVARAVGAVDGLLHDFASPAIGLLRSLRLVLSHPRLLSTLVVPASPEEHSALEKELAKIDEDKDVKLLDFVATPALAARATALMRVARTVLVALVIFTKAWQVVRGDEAGPEVLLTLEDDDPVSVSDDPVGVINDIYLLISSLLERLPASSSSNEASAARQVAVQITESAGLLSTSQLITRHSLQPDSEKPLGEVGMDVDGGGGNKRLSLGKLGPEGRTAHIWRELAGDLRGMLPTEDAMAGERGMLAWLRGVADKAFGEE